MNKATNTSAKKITWVQLCWGIAQLILVGCGIFIICNPSNRLIDIAVCLGLAMLIVGSINIVVYNKNKKRLHGSHWVLADGMSTVLLSLFPLFSEMIQPAIIPFFFGIWELFSGILKVIDSSELKEEKIAGWKWFRNIGCIEILSGVAALLKPVDDFVGMHIIVAIIFFVQSFGFMFKIIMYPKIIKEA